jgi:hypothetical protein
MMLRRLIPALAMVVLLPSCAGTETSLGLRVGGGGFLGTVDDRCYRLIVDVDGLAPAFEWNHLVLGMGANAEFDYWIHQRKLPPPDDFNPYEMRLVAELFPFISLNLLEQFDPVLGAGVTLGTGNLRDVYGERGWPIRGFNIHSSFAFKDDVYYVRLFCTYRYFLESYEFRADRNWPAGGFYDSAPKCREQSFEYGFTPGFRIGSFALEAGITSEHRIYKDEREDDWDWWGQTLEHNIFARISTHF